MADYEQKVFISYAWGEETSEREAIVNQIDQSLQKRGLKIVRDKRDLGYKGSIRKFMERIGEGDSIIVVISDKYLRSKNCMYELVQIAKNRQFADRIFPIILSDAKIYDAGDRLDYIEHWEKEKARLNKRVRELSDFANLQSIQDELNDVDEFRDEIDELAGLLKDMNTLNPAMHRDSDFSELFAAIEKRMRDLGAKLGPAIENNKPVASTIPAGRKPIPVGMMAGAAGVILVIAVILFSVLSNRASNPDPTPAPTQPVVVATSTTAPTQTAVEATVTEESAPAFTPTPTDTPEPVIEPTATPAPISMNCIHSQVWKPASTHQNGLFYTNILTGFSRNSASFCMNWAASAPSLTRWSTEMVAFMRQPTFNSPLSTTGTSLAEEIANIAASGGLTMAMKVFHIVHAQIGSGEGRAVHILRLDLSVTSAGCHGFDLARNLAQGFLIRIFHDDGHESTGDGDCHADVDVPELDDLIALDGGVEVGELAQSQCNSFDNEVVDGDFFIVARYALICLRISMTASILYSCVT
jgi:hypothetical protein